jgi:hypothetical protein
MPHNMQILTLTVLFAGSDNGFLVSTCWLPLMRTHVMNVHYHDVHKTSVCVQFRVFACIRRPWPIVACSGCVGLCSINPSALYYVTVQYLSTSDMRECLCTECQIIWIILYQLTLYFVASCDGNYQPVVWLVACHVVCWK